MASPQSSRVLTKTSRAACYQSCWRTSSGLTPRASAFASRPRLLFADEPTGSLDAATGERVIELLFELNREAGATLVLVTHDPQLADRCAMRLTLHAGRLHGPQALAAAAI
jgi:putative ABC transport system ATP-binding protein